MANDLSSVSPVKMNKSIVHSDDDTLTSGTELFTYPTEAYTFNERNSSVFQSLIVNNTSISDLGITLPGQEATLFYVRNSSFRPSKPSVTLLHGSSNGIVLGALKLGVFAETSFGLGDPSQGEVIWQRLKKVSKWTHGTYEFEFTGPTGNRRFFTWQRTRQPIFSDQPDIELKENVESGGSGEVLAVYTGSQGFMTRKRGTFSIRKGVASASGNKKIDNWNDWELLVILTGCGIIEGARRRARARRSSGGGG